MEIIDIYEDAGKSGKSIMGRPAFKQMLSDIENGLSIDYISSLDLDEMPLTSLILWSIFNPLV
jgi:DNA invertase Pin-like site-specific DNA recombinase